MSWKAIAATMVLSTYAGALLLAPLGWLVATFATDYVVWGMQRNNMTGVWQPAEFAAGLAACWGTLFGFITGGLIVLTRPRSS